LNAAARRRGGRALSRRPAGAPLLRRSAASGPTHRSHSLQLTTSHTRQPTPVLGRFLASLNAYVAEAHAERYAVADYSEYNFARVWGCSQDESNARVHAFFGSRHFAAGIEPVAGAAAALAALRAAAGAELVVVTSRQHIIRAPTLEWLDRHFEGLFSDVHFGNHWAVAGPPPRSKAAMCAAAGAHVLVDDNPGYALECAEAGIEVLLFDWAGEPGGYPWATTAGGGPRHARVARVRDWAQAGAALAALAAERAAR
jgi:hypothetical protein